MSLFDLADLHPNENAARAAAAAARFRLERVQSPDDPRFEAWEALQAYFGPLGEIERRETLVETLRSPHVEADGLHIDYHLVGAWDADGRLAAARDCYTIVEPALPAAVVYLAHAIVLPDYRRTGLATLLRTLPVTLGRQALARAGLPPDGAPILLALEQEPVDPQRHESLVRLTAYGRGGFAVVDPVALPYLQPDFRDLAGLGVGPQPIPLLAEVRLLGHDGATTLPVALASAYVRHLYAAFARHVRAQDLAPALEFSLETLARWGPEPVPLLRLPRHASPEDPALAPLLASRVLPLFPASLFAEPPPWSTP